MLVIHKDTECIKYSLFYHIPPRVIPIVMLLTLVDTGQVVIYVNIPTDPSITETGAPDTLPVGPFIKIK